MKSPIPLPFLLFIFFLTGFTLVSAEGNVPLTLDRLSFRNQPITDILMVLADIGEVSIIPDETVSGSASYHFSTLDFDTALRVFLDTYKLYGIRRDGLIYVSRIDARWNEEAGTVSLHGEDVELRLLLRALSRAMGKTVLFDALPNERLTIHIDDLSPTSALEVLTARLSEHELETKEDYFYIRRTASGDPASRRGQLLSRNNEGLYSLDLVRVRFRDLLKDLFTAEGEEYSLLMRGDAVLEELRFEEKEFSELLRLVLEQANGDYQVSGGIYYIFEIQRRDVLKKLKTTVSLPLEHLPAQSVSALLPPDLAAANLMQADTESNTIILRGSPEEIGPLESFIRSLDRPLQHVSYRRFDLGYADVKDALNLLPPRLSALGPKVLPGTNSFIVPVSDAQAGDFSAYLAALDTPPGHFPVQLKYISAETLIKSLPPAAAKEEIVATVDPTMVFYTGPESRKEEFIRQLALVDRPVPQIRYDLLVVQYQEGQGLNWNTNYENKVANDGDETTFLGSIGSLLNLNFDIVSNFGYLFAVDLSLSLSETRASIMADTTLNGISGETLKFQNTNTYRYRDYEIDSDTGELKSTGVTRELTSGLIINLNGWVSGDGMITMEISATVSRQGSESSTNNPPTTTEKVVSTHVRSPSGKPVVIGGLIQQDQDISISKTPILGDIPLLGRLFQSRTESTDTTEMVIYVVPHVEYPEKKKLSRMAEARRLYSKYFSAPEEDSQ